MKTIILISGKIHSGKNTLADMLKDTFERQGRSVKLDMFAADLKALAYTVSKPLATVLKSIRDGIVQSAHPTWLVSKGNEILKKLTLKEENFYEDKTEISRALLQMVGTDIGRKFIDEDVWVNTFIERTENDEELDIKIVTDVRFPNEIETMGRLDPKGYNIVSIRINRDAEDVDTAGEHISEKALDGYEGFDYVVDNNGTKQELGVKAEQLSKEIMAMHSNEAINPSKVVKTPKTSKASKVKDSHESN